jgi:hypothetical protein
MQRSQTAATAQGAQSFALTQGTLRQLPDEVSSCEETSKTRKRSWNCKSTGPGRAIRPGAIPREPIIYGLGACPRAASSSGRCSSAHRQIASRGSIRLRPSGVREYSTIGGTTG